MKSYCATAKSSPYPPRARIISPSYKGAGFKSKPASVMKQCKETVTVDQMLSDPSIFLDQPYCGIQTTSQKKHREKHSKRNFKPHNESMFLPLSSVGEKYERRGSVKEMTRADSKSSLHDSDKVKTEVEEILASSENTKSLLKRINKNKISTEDLPAILKALIADIDEKAKLIESFKNLIKANTSTITALEIKLNISKKEIESRNAQIENIEGEFDKLKRQIKDLLNPKEVTPAGKNSSEGSFKLFSEKKSFQNQTLNSSLEEAIKLLQPNTSNELLQSLDEINRALQRVPETTHFVNEVITLVKQSSNGTENLDDILAIIKGWMIERNECGKILVLRNNPVSYTHLTLPTICSV
eukprot:TRINITY_DN2628_c0_g1_i2.p1 TRINITY_DN2628_c0_g1~~TRINITY_DN2628_c0_g1_i2.p1  ORF type:complete len:355 (+),score=83.90 TRINITY_DN2628_c0_g1_i2:114-1178(+)